jgi:hypothetical protein
MKALQRKVEIWENERYQISALKFTPYGMLLGERGHYSTQNGISSWTSVAEAEQELISTGWVWDNDSTWTVVVEENKTDSDGWTYGVTFAALEEISKPIQGMTDFVRRRRIIRTQTFMAHMFFSDITCDHCAIEEVTRLSHKFLEVLTICSMASDSTQIIEVLDYAAKCQLLAYLEIGSPDSLILDYKTVIDRLDCFPLHQIGNVRNKWILSAHMLETNDTTEHSQADWEALRNRSCELSRYMFTAEERYELALILIRRHDTIHEYHCSQPSCGNTCQFYPIPCTNEGCNHLSSRKNTEAHDQICTFKKVLCPRGCEEEIIRKDLSHHLDECCQLRKICCTFHSVGCHAEITYAGLKKHLMEDIDQHMSLAMTRIMEQQQVIISLNKRVTALEGITFRQSNQLNTTISTAKEALASVAIAEAHITQSTQHSTDVMKKVDTKLGKDIHKVESEVHTLQTELHHVESDIKGLSQHMNQMDSQLHSTSTMHISTGEVKH